MTSQTCDLHGEISALSTIAEHLRSHVLEGDFDAFGTGSQNAPGRTQKLQNLALLLALEPHETVFTTVQNRLKGNDGQQEYGVLAVMEKPANLDEDMINFSIPFVPPVLHARYLTPMFTTTRGRYQHVFIIENLLLDIHDSWDKIEKQKDLCEAFLSYTLGMTLPEFIHRLKFGTDESAFMEFFEGPPPRVERFMLRDAKVVKGWRGIATRFEEEVNALERDLEMTEDELDDNFQEYTQFREHPENPFSTICNGEVSSKVIALVHMIIRFRLRRMLRSVHILEEYYSVDGAMRLPWHTDPITTPPPQILQMELRRAYVKLNDLLRAYQYFLNQKDSGTELYELPKVHVPQRKSKISQSKEFDQYERSRNDDDIYDTLRNLKWEKSAIMWLSSLCHHYNAAMNLIYYAKKVTRSELLKTRIILRILPNIAEVPTRDIDLYTALAYALNDPSASIDTQEKYDRILDALSEFARDDDWFRSCVQDGFPSIKPIAVRFFFELINSTFPSPYPRGNMPKWDHTREFEHMTNKQAYAKTLQKWIGSNYPKIGCNRAVPWVAAVTLDQLIIEHYGNVSHHHNLRYKHGQLSGSVCWKKIFATALPEGASDHVANRVLDKLRADFRRRMKMLGLEKVQYWINTLKGEDSIEMESIEPEATEEYEEVVEREYRDGMDIDLE